MKDFSHFSQWIPKAIARYNISRETRAALVCERFRKLAPTLIGAESLDHVQPKYFKHGILYIAVPNSLWAQQVYVHRHDLIMKLNINLENEWVQDIRTHVGPIESEFSRES